jgi:hypothetical protein
VPEKPIPSPIQAAIRAAAGDDASLLMALRLFVEDTGEPGPDDQVTEGRLERAVARAMLEAWLHGVGSAASVGLAYAAVGNCLMQALGAV